MKKKIGLLLTILLVFITLQAFAAGEMRSGAFTYRIKGNGTAAITGYDWSSKEIYIPRTLNGYTVTEIDAEAFAKLSYDENGIIKNNSTNRNEVNTISTLVIPDTIVYIGERAFMNNAFETYSISIPASVEHIGAGAFSNLDGVKQFVVDSGNQRYATIDGVLYDKIQKELVAWPRAYNGKEGTMFEYFDKYIIQIPEGIVRIGDYAFFGLDYLSISLSGADGAHFVLPSTLKEIGDYAFAYAAEFTMFAEVEGESLFSSLPCNLWFFPDALEKIGKGAFYKAIRYSSYGDDQTYILLGNTQIEEIPAFAFYDCWVEEQIILPKMLTTIGESAFATIYRGQIVGFPASLEYIGKNAFNDYDTSGVSLNLSACVKLKEIDDGAFANSKLKTVVLPNGLQRIGSGVFENCDYLTELTIPSSVTFIGDNLCDRGQVKLNVEPYSYAATWASENGYITQSAGGEDTSWLN